MNNDLKNIITSENGKPLELKDRSFFEKRGYSLRQVIIAVLTVSSAPHTPYTYSSWTKKMKAEWKEKELNKEVTDDIWDDYIGQDSMDKKRIIFIKEHLKKNRYIHGLMIPFPPVFIFSLIIFPSDGFWLFYLPIQIVSSFVTLLLWKFYGLSWFLKGFEKDVIRYALEKSLKKTDENEVKYVGGIALQSYKDESLDLDEVIKSLAKEDEREEDNSE